MKVAMGCNVPRETLLSRCLEFADDRHVPRGTTYSAHAMTREMFHMEHSGSHTRFTDFYGVPGETSCILAHRLLDFRWAGNIGSNYRRCKPKGWSRQDHNCCQSCRLSCFRRTGHSSHRLRFPGECYGGDWLRERPLSSDPLPHPDSQRAIRQDHPKIPG